MIRGRGCVAAAMFLAGTLAACNGILGIEGAEVDPSLRDGGVGGALPVAVDAAIDAAADAAPVTCAKYCADVTAHCTGANQQYFDEGTCLRMCPGFLVGPNTGDTLACRAQAAAGAKQEPTTGCLQAGPFGAAPCVARESPACAAFCGLASRLCGAAFPYAGVPECFSACLTMAFKNGGRLFGAGGALLDGDLNTLDCRMSHLEIAFSQGDEGTKRTHCPHTALEPAKTLCVRPVADAGKD